jgi:uncharacterized protein (DUF305 family)
MRARRIEAEGDASMSKTHYGRLLLMAGLSFLSMYVFMYAMVDTLENVHSNLNQVYMAGLMTAPMVIIELALMGAMYPDKKMNLAIGAASLFALIIFWVLVRQQAAISDQQFLRSMIPHHASALLMCGKAPIQDPEIKELCRSIVASQQAEILQMKARLNRLEK